MKEYVISDILGVCREYATAKNIFHKSLANDSWKDALSNDMYISLGK